MTPEAVCTMYRVHGKITKSAKCSVPARCGNMEWLRLGLGGGGVHHAGTSGRTPAQSPHFLIKDMLPPLCLCPQVSPPTTSSKIGRFCRQLGDLYTLAQDKPFQQHQQKDVEDHPIHSFFSSSIQLRRTYLILSSS